MHFYGISFCFLMHRQWSILLDGLSSEQTLVKVVLVSIVKDLGYLKFWSTYPYFAKFMEYLFNLHSLWQVMLSSAKNIFYFHETKTEILDRPSLSLVRSQSALLCTALLNLFRKITLTQFIWSTKVSISIMLLLTF